MQPFTTCASVFFCFENEIQIQITTLDLPGFTKKVGKNPHLYMWVRIY